MTEESRNYLPPWWDEEADRLAYFSPFRTATANHEGSRAKMIAWKVAIETYSKSTFTTIFSVEELKKSFSNKGKIPLCLEMVVEDMLRYKEIVTLEDFLKKPEPWRSWILTMGKAPMFWAWSKVRNAVFKPSVTDVKYVHIDIVKVKAEELMEQASDIKGEVVSISTLMKMCNWPETKVESFLIVVYWLHCQGRAGLENFTFDCPSKILVKLAKCGVKGHEVAITEADNCKYKMKDLIKKVEEKIANYEEKCETAKKDARAAMSKFSKVVALNHLRKKKLYDRVIQKEVDKLHNLENLLEALQETESNKEVITVLKATNIAIKNNQKENAIETVEDLMEELRETIEETEEIGSTLSQSVVADDDVQEDLASLEKDIASENDLCKWIAELKLPAIPDSPKIEGDGKLSGTMGRAQ